MSSEDLKLKEVEIYIMLLRSSLFLICKSGDDTEDNKNFINEVYDNNLILTEDSEIFINACCYYGNLPILKLLINKNCVINNEGLELAKNQNNNNIIEEFKFEPEVVVEKTDDTENIEPEVVVEKIFN